MSTVRADAAEQVAAAHAVAEAHRGEVEAERDQVLAERDQHTRAEIERVRAEVTAAADARVTAAEDRASAAGQAADTARRDAAFEVGTARREATEAATAAITEGRRSDQPKDHRRRGFPTAIRGVARPRSPRPTPGRELEPAERTQRQVFEGSHRF